MSDAVDPSPVPEVPEGWIGVDLGIVNIATLSDGDTLPGMEADVRTVREKRFRHRQALQTANTRRARWRLRQLTKKEQLFISYKAQAAGVLVELVDPRTTSRTCSACGCCDKANRISQALFSCLSCGFAAPADRNAAINIARGVSQASHRAAPSLDG